MSPRTASRPGSRACSSSRSTSSSASSSSSPRRARRDLVHLGVGLELFLVVLFLGVRVVRRGGAGTAGLERLHELVALVLVDGRVVAQQDPLGGVVFFVPEQLEVDMG